jgi:cyclophilin family peptidyl-prolyl cis-trans isomerase
MAASTRLAALASTLAALSLGACGGDDEGETTAATPAEPSVQFERPERVLERGEPATATVETTQGSFEIELDTRGSPKTTNSFAFLADEGFYDGTDFHRIVPDFVVQGGDPTGTGSGGPGYSIDEPPPEDTEYVRGTVAMANVPGVDPPGRSGSQFFVVVAADAGLPPTSPLLGQVSKGFGVVQRIAQLGDPASGQTGTPLEVVTIESVEIETG